MERALGAGKRVAATGIPYPSFQLGESDYSNSFYHPSGGFYLQSVASLIACLMSKVAEQAIVQQRDGYRRSIDTVCGPIARSLRSARPSRHRRIRREWPVLNPILNPGFQRATTYVARNFYTGSMERSEYVEQRNGGFYVAGKSVSLDSIVYSFKAGDSPETIRQSFSSLTLGQVYGVIAFYLAHEQEVDANIREGEEEIQRSVPPLSESRPELYARLERARHQIASQDLAKP